MKNDDQAIRQWFGRSIRATTEGDLQLARSPTADDAVFLVPGADRMDEESFAAAATADDPNIAFELDCSIQEIQVLGDHGTEVVELGPDTAYANLLADFDKALGG